MRIKRFTAKSLPEVIQQIKLEFGMGAVILSQRENPENGWAEVTAGVREEDLPENDREKPPDIPEPGCQSGKPAPSPETARPVSPGTPPGTGFKAYQKAVRESRKAKSNSEAEEGAGLKAELKETVNSGIKEIRELILNLAHRQSLSEKWRDQAELIKLYRCLLKTSLEPELARDLAEKAAESSAAWGGDLLSQLRQTVRPLVKCREGALPRILAILGPSGSGKTTVLVKLAALAQKRALKTAAITLDTLKLGAAGQLAQYARIMGMGVKACQSRAEFDEAREIFGSADLILVDTSTRDFLGDRKSALLEGAEAQTLLVLPANLKSEDLIDIYQRTAGPDLWGLVLTKLDETRTLGSLLNLFIKVSPALGFFSTGPRIPEDFIPAQADKFLDLWLRPPLEEG
ncbi:MAG: hypothetical protein LBP22_01810 [Deltaproteobacteria bacterium]|jgi:flagellar biosynthesis protein FlhF|nr:hypothetical protein [Deltaproteobacteria bacterium]